MVNVLGVINTSKAKHCMTFCWIAWQLTPCGDKPPLKFMFQETGIWHIVRCCSLIINYFSELLESRSPPSTNCSCPAKFREPIFFAHSSSLLCFLLMIKMFLPLVQGVQVCPVGKLKAYWEIQKTKWNKIQIFREFGGIFFLLEYYFLI